MKTTKYNRLTLDELFEALQVAAINNHDVFVRGDPIKHQRDWARVYGDLYIEIESRGEEALQRYVPFLQAPHPAVRLAGALGLRDVAPDIAAPVLEELGNGGYTGAISLDARTTLSAMRTEGLISTSK